MAFALGIVAGVGNFAAALDQDMSLMMVSMCVSAYADCSFVRHTLSASFREKLLSQCVQGKGLTAR
jgi:nitrate/nitrite transporter NarK